jgi:hypothetical protein
MYSISPSVAVSGNLSCRVSYTRNKGKTTINEVLMNSSNTSGKRSENFQFLLDPESGVTSVDFRVKCSGVFNGANKTLESTQTLPIISDYLNGNGSCLLADISSVTFNSSGNYVEPYLVGSTLGSGKKYYSCLRSCDTAIPNYQ